MNTDTTYILNNALTNRSLHTTDAHSVIVVQRKEMTEVLFNTV